MIKNYLLIILLLVNLLGCSVGGDATGTEDGINGVTEVPNTDITDVPGTDITDVDFSLLEDFNKRIVSERFNLNDNISFSADNYSSSNSDIASIDTMGNVVIKKEGVVEITASTVDATTSLFSFIIPNAYAATDATFSIVAKAAVFFMKAWVGEDDSILDFNQSLIGLNFSRTTEDDCDPITQDNCINLESDLITNNSITDNISDLSTPGYYHFTYGKNTAATSVLSASKFDVRSGEATVVFQDKLFLIGGYTTGDVLTPREYKNDVWVSYDGGEWIKLVENAEFSSREGHQVIVHDNKLWLMGGANGATVHNDVWVSEDGKTWTEVEQTSNYSIRSHFEIFTLNDVFYMAGGYTTSGAALNDLWKSDDAANWSQVTGFSLAVADNSPIVVFGESGSQTAFLLSDKTYSSSNGTDWAVIDESPLFKDFSNREATIFNDEIWLFTYTYEYFGSSYGYKNISRIYKSPDGINWTKVNGGIYIGNLIAREIKPIAFQDNIFSVGGRAEILEYTNEVWSTDDGELWLEHTLGGFYGPRYGHAMTSHNGKLYSTGGVNSDNIGVTSPYRSDVWSSDDGLNWTLVADEHPTFRARAGHTLLSVGDKLCYVGGYGRTAWGTASGHRYPYTGLDPDPAGSVLHVILFEIYGAFSGISCSTDGGTVWSEVSPSTSDYLDARTGSASVYFNDKIWIIGGKLNDTYYSDVWSTGTTSTWDDRPDLGTYGSYLTEFTEATSSAPFGARTGHAVTVHNGAIYLSGGKNSSGEYLDDLWKSDDGVNWVEVTDDIGTMDKRAFHQMVSFDNKLWIIAGRANYHETIFDESTTVYEANDIWVSSDDGLNWTEVVTNASFEQRQEFQAVVHDNNLFITGGTGGDGYVSVQGKDSILNDVWRSEDGVNWRAGFYKQLELSE